MSSGNQIILRPERNRTINRSGSISIAATVLPLINDWNCRSFWPSFDTACHRLRRSVRPAWYANLSSSNCRSMVPTRSYRSLVLKMVNLLSLSAVMSNFWSRYHPSVRYSRVDRLTLGSNPNSLRVVARVHASLSLPVTLLIAQDCQLKQSEDRLSSICDF